MRNRSVIITSSARSLSLELQLVRSRASRSGVAPRGRVPLISRVVTWLAQLQNCSGDELANWKLPHCMNAENGAGDAVAKRWKSAQPLGLLS